MEESTARKIIDITSIQEVRGGLNSQVGFEEEDEYAGLNELLKKASTIIRTYGIVYFVAFIFSAWVANRMFDFVMTDPISGGNTHPLTETCLVFTSILILYVCASQFWRYMFSNIVNIDDALTIKKLYKLWWLRLCYIGLLGTFLTFTWIKVGGVTEGRNFAVFVSIVFGAELLFFILCEVFFQKIYKQLKKY